MNNPTMYDVTGPEQEILNLCVAKGYVPLVLHPTYRDIVADKIKTPEPAPWYLIQAGGTQLSGFLTVHPLPAEYDWNETDSDALKQWLSDLPTAWERLEEQARARWESMKQTESEKNQ